MIVINLFTLDGSWARDSKRYDTKCLKCPLLMPTLAQRIILNLALQHTLLGKFGHATWTSELQKIKNSVGLFLSAPPLVSDSFMLPGGASLSFRVSSPTQFACKAPTRQLTDVLDT